MNIAVFNLILYAFLGSNLVCVKTLGNYSASTSTDVVNETDNDLKICGDYVAETEYVLLENGSLLLPKSESLYDYHTYFVQNGTAFVYVDKVSAITESDSSSLYNFSIEFLSCGHTMIDSSEYELLKNGSVYIDNYSKIYGPRDYYIQEHGVYVCVPQFEDMKQSVLPNSTLERHLNKFSDTFPYHPDIGLLLSIIFSLYHLVVFCLVPSAQNPPGCCWASLNLSLFLANACFLSVGLVEKTNTCAHLEMSIYYFYLTTVFWLNAIAFDVWRSVRVVMPDLRISSHRVPWGRFLLYSISSHKVPWRRFLLYSIYSWMVPAALTTLVTAADSTDLLPVDYRPSFGSSICWFGRRKALRVFFTVPYYVVMLLTAVFFLDVTFVISRASRKITQTHEATLKERFFMFMRLTHIMFLRWTVGLGARSADVEVLWYLFINLNTFQELFIFIVFSCSSEVRNLCFKNYRMRSKTRGSTSVRAVSQISADIYIYY